MKKVYNIRVSLLSPMHINGGVSADSMRITVKQDGKPYIPATLFKGIVRSNFRMLMKTFQSGNDLTDYFFGIEGFKKSRFIFDNLETEQELLTETRTNVSISRYQRKALDGALVLTETVSCFDKEQKPVVFEGNVTAYYPTEDKVKYDSFLRESIKMISAIGTGKSRGFGFVEVSAVEEG